MKAVIKKEILYDLQRAEDILRVREPKDFEELKKLSDHAIEDVALYKDVDLITMTVLIYSFYKIIQAITPKEALMIVRELQFAQQALQQDNYGRYNKSIRTLYEQVKKLVRDGVLRIYENIPQGKVTQLARLANSSFSIQNKTMDVIQSGEMESVVAALQEGAQALVIDERTIRLFIESPLEMEKLLEMRFQKNVIPNRQRLQEFSRQLQGIPIIRSIELVGAAFTLGLLDPYIPPEKKGREELLSAVLWATKYNGCAVTDHEVGEMEAFLLRKK